jgi:hypothetical protein
MIWLNVALAGLLAFAVVRLRDEWQAARAHREAVLRKSIAPAPAPEMPPTPKPSPVTASTYSEIAQKMLYSKDRNPTIVVAPPEVKPPRPMPPLPVVFGVMGLPSGAVALMSEARGKGSKGYRQGEKIGEFEIAQLDTKQITLHWEDKIITKDINELIDRGGGAEAGPGAGAPSVAPSVAAVAPPPAGKAGTPGIQMTEGIKACQPGDQTPDGTVADGMRKVSVATPFGNVCHWESVK